MNPYAFPPLIAAILNFMLVYWVYQRAPAGLLRRTFIFWNLWIGFWNSSIAVGYLLTDAHTAYWWYKITLAPVVGLITSFFLHFVVIYTESSNARTRGIVRLSYLSGLVLSILGWFTPLILGGSKAFFWGYYLQAGKAEWLVGICYLSQVGYAFWLLVRAMNQEKGLRQIQIKWLLLGSIVCFAGGVTNFLPLFGIALYPLGNLMNSLYSLAVAYTIVEHELLDVQLVFRRGTVYGILSGGLTVVYLSLVAVLQRLFGHYGVQESIAFYTAAFPLTVVLAPTMKNRIEPYVDRTFFGKVKSNPTAHFKSYDMALMGVLATEMAHELAKPLTHIMNEGSRLGHSAKGASKEGLARIEKAAQRAAEILDGFALLSPDRPLHQIAVPMPDLLEETLMALGVEEDPTLRVVRRYGSFPAVFVNPGQIVQIFTNVIQNAWQAMRQGGTLTLSLETQSNNPSIIDIVIEDTGPGIPSELLNTVFEPFFTTKQNQGGRGVGLTISRAMVERHGGQIRIESPIRLQGGTRVTISLPIEKKENSYGV